MQTLPSKNVLIIDDDKLVLQTLSTLFVKDNWSVQICQNGQDGLKEAQNKHHDCIILDIRMPELSGPQVLEHLRRLEEKNIIKKQNVIFLTGYADEDATTKAFQLGAYSYLHKPFDVKELLEKANACVATQQVLSVFEQPTTEEDERLFKKIRKNYDRESMGQKADILSRKLDLKLQHIRNCSYNTEYFQGNIENPIGIAQIPLGLVGPIAVKGNFADGEYLVPMATTEGALLLTYDLGSKLLGMAGPVEVETLNKVIHISPMFPIQADEEKKINDLLDNDYSNIKQVAEGGSSHTHLLGIDRVIVKDNFVLRFRYDTEDAHGLNMINQATFNACKYIQAKTGARFFHRSHYSGVKHHSHLNEDQGYGRRVKARGIITSKALAMLRVSAVQMKEFFDRCRDCAHAASIKSVNVHAANALAGIFIACGQDVADLSSSHVCDTICEFADDKKSLVITSELKNLLVATVGGGTGLGTQSECLKIMQCFGSGKSGVFAEVIAAIVMAGEFPTAAAVISETYVDIHNKYGRNKNKLVRDYGFSNN